MSENRSVVTGSFGLASYAPSADVRGPSLQKEPADKALFPRFYLGSAFRAHFKVKMHHDRGRNLVKSKYLFSFPLLGSQAASGRERRSDDDVRHRPVPRRHAQLGRLLKF